jgi:hypothetical protein
MLGVLHQGASVRLRLSCSVREQALRFIERETDAAMLSLAREALPPHLSSLRAALPFLRPLSHPQVSRISALFEDNDTRDEDDSRRYAELYGTAPELSHANPALYDAIIDTTNNQPEDTFTQAIDIITKHCTLPPPPRQA